MEIVGLKQKKNASKSNKKAWQVVKGSKADADTSDHQVSDEAGLLEEIIRDDDLSASEVEALLNYLGILPEALIVGGKGRDALNKRKNREFDRWLRARKGGSPLSARDIIQGAHRLLPKYGKDQTGRRPAVTPQGPDKGPSSGPPGSPGH